MNRLVVFASAMLLAVTAGAGELSVDEWQRLNEWVGAAFHQPGAGVLAETEGPQKCATPQLSRLLMDMPKDLSGKSLLFPGREDTMSFTYNTEHFQLHYTDQGPNAVYDYDVQTVEPGFPDYIVEAGVTCEFVWSHIIDDLGFNPPLSDTIGGFDDDYRIDVYFVDFDFYGATAPERVVATNPRRVTCYMFMENDYDPETFPGYQDARLDAFRVTMAHEFFHTVQFAIDFDEAEQGGNAPYWQEMSSVYMEEELYSAINDYYSYLRYFYVFPHWSLRTGSLSNPAENLHMYASGIFPIMLSRFYGSGIIKEIWDRCGDVPGPNWVQASNDAIKFLSSGSDSLASMFRQFTIWNFFTGQRARSGEYFPEASNYDSVRIAYRVNQYPALIDSRDSLQKPDNLGANYVLLNNVGVFTQGLGVGVEFEDRTQPWSIAVLGLPQNYTNPANPIYIDPTEYDSTTTLFSIPNASDFNKLVLIPAVLGGDELDLEYSLNIVPITGQFSVISPAGGELLIQGETVPVTWSPDFSVDSVLIELSTDGGTNWEEVTRTVNDLVYDWEVPSLTSADCFLRISDLADGDPVDVSDSPFRIQERVAERFQHPYPNPVAYTGNERVTFKVSASVEELNKEEQLRVIILTLAGEKVRTLGYTYEGLFVVARWDMRNEAGEIVAPGPYIAIVNFAGDEEKYKLMVLR